MYFDYTVVDSQRGVPPDLENGQGSKDLQI
jgi:hypothetical protein